jgi:tetratricopeptide (TPR) repeat protein
MSLPIEQSLSKARRHAKRGETEQAAEIYRRVLEKYPQNRKAQAALDGLGPSADQMNALIALYTSGQLERALAEGEALAARFPSAAFVPNLLGAVNAGLGRLEAAAACYTRALELKSGYAEAHSNLADTLNALGRPEQAMANLAEALRLEPDFAEAHNNMGNALYLVGRFAEAANSYERALAIMPDYAEAHRNLSTVKTYRDDDAQVAAMRELLARDGQADRVRMNLSFALGKAYDDLGDADSAFSFLAEGNRLRKLELGYELVRDQALFAQLKAQFAGASAPMASASAAQAGTGKTPVFVLGMPRSGTTLVEQVLASHSRVFGGGELELLEPLVAAHASAEAPPTAASAARIRDGYLAGLAKLGATEAFVTDKLPLNFRWIGYICAALPEAKIVHVQRDARATCWSCFKHYFSSRGNGFAHDLRDVARYFSLYTDLMAFWHDRFPGRIYDLSYESLTERQDEETRSLLAHLGLDWEDACLSFHTAERSVQTASATQVRQRLYQGSSDAWRRYEAHLGPMLEALAGQ